MQQEIEVILRKGSNAAHSSIMIKLNIGDGLLYSTYPSAIGAAEICDFHTATFTSELAAD